MLKTSFFYLLTWLLVICACKSKPETSRKVENTKSVDTFVASETKKTVVTNKSNPEKEVPDSIYSDTIWVNHYQNDIWKDSVINEDYKALFIVKVDTTDLIIDTVKSLKGSRITIGYNHYYSLIFTRKNKPWFTVSFNKREDLESLIGGTDYWLESNLDVFHRLVYNEKYQKFIIEFDINPRYNIGSVYYFVIDTQGKIDYTGTARSWGGGNPDGVPFITDDNTSYVSCYEVYNFKTKTAMALSDFAANAELKTFGVVTSPYKGLHALRNLSKNNILTVFNRSDNNPDFNAIIINTDTTVVKRFKYYGLMEEMNAEFLFRYDTLQKKFYIYDTDREVLIGINEKDPSNIKEYDVKTMVKVNGDSMSGNKYDIISFEIFGNYRFYRSENDTSFYCDIDKLE
jgi:hypothetical protein